MGILKIVALIFAGLVGVVATEAGVVSWLTYAPVSLDLTGNFFTLTIFPVVTVVVLVATLLLWKILADNPLRNCMIFSTVYIAAETTGLFQLGNPTSVVAIYGAIIAGACTAIFTIFSKWIWVVE